MITGQSAKLKVYCRSIIYTTICGSDLRLYHNEITGMRDGDIIGHEGVGVVEEADLHLLSLTRMTSIYYVDLLSSVCLNRSELGISAVIACGNVQSIVVNSCDTTNPSKDMEEMYGKRWNTQSY